MDPCSMLVLIGSLFLSDRRELLRYVMIRFQYFWRECKTSSPTPAPQLASEPLHYNHRSLHRNLSVDSSRSFGTVTESLVISFRLAPLSFLLLTIVYHGISVLSCYVQFSSVHVESIVELVEF
ncbi:hypothetical protein RchiOBHm_Chr4g0444221 [Rosa chinensis]|uniref:Uncharacterized protein n=1 Tax=Rosa chinensis TaxID=74649 RepID=A0A2P6R421_ROSCH|nr:hypothetical protein RchiOBHm_Chr4g0444221 [Rosa chinensis]